MDSSSGQATSQEATVSLAELFRARHERLRYLLAERRLDALVIAHLPNITYISGFRGSAGLLVATPGRLYLLVDFRYSAAVARAAEAGALAPDLEVLQVEGSYDRLLVAWLAEKWTDRAATDKPVAADKPESGGVAVGQASARIGFESAHVSVARHEWWRRELAGRVSGPVDWVLVEGAVEDGRQRKDAHEIAVTREAARMLSAVAREVLDEVVRPGRSEAVIAADIDWRLRRAGFEKPAFDTIVAAGPNGALPHAVPTSRPLAPGDLVLLDFGGVYGGYCVDLTRTVGLDPVPQEARRLYDAVFDAHAAALAAAARPGVTTGEVDAAARDLLTSRGLGDRFGHGTGHGLGLEIHEAPRLTRRTTDHPGETPLAAGMIFTIEPGAYVPGLGGVRIEDDVLVTPEGCELLTDTPRAWREL